jgi:hypothetical protein
VYIVYVNFILYMVIKKIFFIMLLEVSIAIKLILLP